MAPQRARRALPADPHVIYRVSRVPALGDSWLSWIAGLSTVPTYRVESRCPRHFRPGPDPFCRPLRRPLRRPPARLAFSLPARSAVCPPARPPALPPSPQRPRPDLPHPPHTLTRLAPPSDRLPSTFPGSAPPPDAPSARGPRPRPARLSAPPAGQARPIPPPGFLGIPTLPYIIYPYIPLYTRVQDRIWPFPPMRPYARPSNTLVALPARRLVLLPPSALPYPQHIRCKRPQSAANSAFTHSRKRPVCAEK